MRQSRALAIGTAIALVIAIAVIVSVVLRPTDGTPSATTRATPTASASAASAAPTATPTEAPPAVTGFEWILADFPGGPLHGASRIGNQWVALNGLEAWRSSDAATWEAATVDDTPQEAQGQLRLGPVAMLDETAYSVGQWFGPVDAVHPVVWSSTDGSAWTQVVPTAPWGYLANDVASDGEQLAVAGSFFGFGDGRVWTSPDATTWSEHTSDGGPATLNAIHGDGDGFVAAGIRIDANLSVPAIWTSADGESWTDATLPEVEGEATLLDVARLPSGRYVVLGILTAQADTGEFFAWYADDPATWTDAGIVARGNVPGLLLTTDNVLLAITGGIDGPVVGMTTDGVAWTELPPLPLPDVVARVSAAATDGHNVILLGGTDDGAAHFAWLGSPTSD